MTYSLNHSITLEKIEKEMIDDRPTGMNQSIKNLPKGKERNPPQMLTSLFLQSMKRFHPITYKVSIQDTVQVHHAHVQLLLLY